MTNKWRLSLCILTKDDKGYPPNCLALMRDFADEIIIAEISSDASAKEVLKAEEISIHKLKWENSHSKIKNYCMEIAKGDWILFLEGNETLTPTEFSKLKGLLQNPNAEGYILNIDRTLCNQRMVSPIAGLRLIRVRREYRFLYRAFERIPDEAISHILEANIYITPTQQQFQMREDISLTELLAADLRDYPQDCYLKYIKGISLLNRKSYEAAAKALKEAHKLLNKDYLFAQHLYKTLSWTLSTLNRDAEALAVLEEGIINYPLNSDFHILRGELRKKQKLYEDALIDLERALKLKGQSQHLPIKPAIATSTIYELMGDIHREVFNLPHALLCYREAFELNKQSYRLLYRIGDLAEEGDNIHILLELMEAAIIRKDSQAMLILVYILFQQRKFNEAIRYLDALEKITGGNENIEVLRYVCYCWMGEKEEAEAIYAGTITDVSVKNQLLLQKIEDLWVHQLWGPAESLLNRIDMTEELRGLYHGLHQLLKSNISYENKLTTDEYEIVFSLQKRLLWCHQAERAELLLPLLLKDIDGDKGIKLATLWTEYYDFNAIEGIFRCIKTSDRRKFLDSLILQLLRHDSLDAALRLKEVGATDIFAPIEVVLNSREYRAKINSRISKLKKKLGAEKGAVHKRCHLPSEELFHFYLSLSRHYNSDKGVGAVDREGLTTEENFILIGDIYLGQQKWREALVAYLRGLQWHPFNRAAKGKLAKIFREIFREKNPSASQILNSSILPEGEYFSHEEEFYYFVEGLIDLTCFDYDAALDSFDKASFRSRGYNPSRLYILALLWFTAREERAALLWQETEDKEAVIDTIHDIWCDLHRDRLIQEQRQYAYSQLISQEIDSIKLRT